MYFSIREMRVTSGGKGQSNKPKQRLSLASSFRFNSNKSNTSYPFTPNYQQYFQQRYSFFSDPSFPPFGKPLTLLNHPQTQKNAASNQPTFHRTLLHCTQQRRNSNPPQQKQPFSPPPPQERPPFPPQRAYQRREQRPLQRYKQWKSELTNQAPGNEVSNEVSNEANNEANNEASNETSNEAEVAKQTKLMMDMSILDEIKPPPPTPLHVHDANQIDVLESGEQYVGYQGVSANINKLRDYVITNRFHAIFQFINENNYELNKAMNYILIRFSNAGRVQEVIKLVSHLIQHNQKSSTPDTYVQIDIPVVIRIINDIIKAEKYELALEMFNMFKSRVDFYPTEFSCSLLIKLFSRAGKLSEAEDTFREMKKMLIDPTNLVYGNMIEAHAKLGNTDRCIELVLEMSQYNVEQDIFIYNALLSGLMEYDPCKVMKIYQGIIQKQFGDITPDVHTFSLVLSAYFKLNMVDEAVELLECIITEQPHNLNTVVYNTVISGLVENNRFVEAEKYFKSLVFSDSHFVDRASIIPFIKYAAKFDDLEVGERFYALLLRLKLKPTAGVLNYMITIHMNRNNVKQALDYHYTFHSEQLNVGKSHLQVILLDHIQNNTFAPFEEFFINEFNDHTNVHRLGLALCNILLLAMCRLNSVSYTNLIFQRMIQANLRMNVMTYDVMMNFYVNQEQFSYCLNLYNKSMQDARVMTRDFKVKYYINAMISSANLGDVESFVNVYKSLRQNIQSPRVLPNKISEMIVAFRKSGNHEFAEKIQSLF